MWRWLALALFSTAFLWSEANAATQVTAALTGTRPPVIPTNVKFPISFAANTAACTSLKVTRFEGVFPVVVAPSTLTVGSCTYEIDGTGVVIETATSNPDCLVTPSATSAINVNIAFSHVPVEPPQIIMHSSGDTCSMEFTLTGFTSDVIPGAKAAMDPENSNSVLISFFNFFGSSTAKPTRYSLVLPEALTRAVATTAPSITWVYPTNCGNGFSAAYPGVPQFSDTGSSGVFTFAHGCTTALAACDPCVVRVSGVAMRSNAYTYTFHPGSISAISNDNSNAVAELPLVTEAATLTSSVISCNAGYRLTQEIMLSLKISEVRRFSSVRFDVPPFMRAPGSTAVMSASAATTGAMTTLTPTMAADASTVTGQAANPISVSGDFRVAVTNAFYCPSDASTYELTVSLLDNLGGIVAAGPVKFSVTHGVLPLTITPVSGTNYESVAAGTQMSVTISVNVASYFAGASVSYTPAVIIPQALATLLNGDLVTTPAATKATPAGSNVVAYTLPARLATALVATCHGATANTAASCAFDIPIAMTFNRFLRALPPFDFQVVFVRSGAPADILRLISATGSISFPSLRPLALPLMTPSAVQLSYNSAENALVSPQMLVSLAAHAGAGVSNAATVAVTVSNANGCTVTLSPNNNQLSAIMATTNKAVSFSVKCPWNIAPDLFRAYATVTIFDKINGVDVAFASAPPATFRFEPQTKLNTPTRTVPLQKVSTQTFTDSAPPGFSTYTLGRRLRIVLPSRTTLTGANAITAVVANINGWSSCADNAVVDSVVNAIDIPMSGTCSPTSNSITVTLNKFAIVPGHYQPNDNGAVILEYWVRMPDSTAWSNVYRSQWNYDATATSDGVITIDGTFVQGRVVPTFDVNIVHSAVDPDPTFTLQTPLNANQGLIVVLPPIFTQFGVPTVTYGGQPVTILRYGVTSDGPNARYFEFAEFNGAPQSTMLLRYTNIQTASTIDPAIPQSVSARVVLKSNPNVVTRSFTVAGNVDLPSNIASSTATAAYARVPCSVSASAPSVSCFNLRTTYELERSMSPSDTPSFAVVIPVRPEVQSLFSNVKVFAAIAGIRVALTPSATAGYKGYFTAPITAADGLVYTVGAGVPVVVEVLNYPVPSFSHISMQSDNAHENFQAFVMTPAGIKQSTVVGTTAPLTDVWGLVNYAPPPGASISTVVSARFITKNTIEFVVNGDFPFANAADVPAQLPRYHAIKTISVTLPEGITRAGGTVELKSGLAGTVTATGTSPIVITLGTAAPPAAALIRFTISGVTAAENLNYISGRFVNVGSTAWIKNLHAVVRIASNADWVTATNLVPIEPLVAPALTSNSGPVTRLGSDYFATTFSITGAFSGLDLPCNYEITGPTAVLDNAVSHSTTGAGYVTATLGSSSNVAAPGNTIPPFAGGRTKLRVGTALAACTSAAGYHVRYDGLPSARLYGRTPFVFDIAPAPSTMFFSGPSATAVTPVVRARDTENLPGNGAVQRVLVAPDAKRVYIVRGNSFIVFTRGNADALAPNTGSLSNGLNVDAGGPITALAISPDSRVVYVATQGSNTLLRYFAYATNVKGTEARIKIEVGTGFVQRIALDFDGILARGVMSLDFGVLPAGQFLFVTDFSGRSLKIPYDWYTGDLGLGLSTDLAAGGLPAAVTTTVGSGIVGLARSGVFTFAANSATSFATLPTISASAHVNDLLAATGASLRLPTTSGSTVPDRLLGFAQYHIGGIAFKDSFIATSSMGDVWILSLNANPASGATVAGHVRVETSLPFRAVAVSPITGKTGYQAYIFLAGGDGRFWVLTAAQVGNRLHLEVDAAATDEWTKTTLPSIVGSSSIVSMDFSSDGANLYVALASGTVAVTQVAVDAPADVSTVAMRGATGSADFVGAVPANVPVTVTLTTPVVASLNGGTLVAITLPKGASFDGVTIAVNSGSDNTWNTANGVTPTRGNVDRDTSARPSTSVSISSANARVVRVTLNNVIFASVAAEPTRMFSPTTVPKVPLTVATARSMFDIRVSASGNNGVVLQSLVRSPVATLPVVFYTPTMVMAVTHIAARPANPGSFTLIITPFGTASGTITFAAPAGLDSTLVVGATNSNMANVCTATGSLSCRVRRSEGSVVFTITASSLAAPGTVTITFTTKDVRDASATEATYDAGTGTFKQITVQSIVFPATVASSTPSWSSFETVPPTGSNIGDLTATFVLADDAKNAYVGTSEGFLVTFAANNNGAWSYKSSTKIFDGPVTHLKSVQNAHALFAFADSTSQAGVFQRTKNGDIAEFDPRANVYALSSRRFAACQSERVNGGCDVAGLTITDCGGSARDASPMVGCINFAVVLRCGASLSLTAPETGRTPAVTRITMFDSSVGMVGNSAEDAVAFEWYTYDNGISLAKSYVASGLGGTGDSVITIDPIHSNQILYTSNMLAMSPTFSPYNLIYSCINAAPEAESSIYRWLLFGDGRVGIVSYIDGPGLLAISEPIPNYRTERATSLDALPNGSGVVVGTAAGNLYRFATVCNNNVVSIVSMSNSEFDSSSLLDVSDPILQVRLSSSGRGLFAITKGGFHYSEVPRSININGVSRAPEPKQTPGDVERFEPFILHSVDSFVSLFTLLASGSGSNTCAMVVNFDFENAKLKYPVPDVPLSGLVTEEGETPLLRVEFNSGSPVQRTCEVANDGFSLTCAMTTTAIPTANIKRVTLEKVYPPTFMVLDLTASVFVRCGNNVVARSSGVPVYNMQGVVTLVRPGSTTPFDSIGSSTEHLQVAFVPAIYHADNSFLPYSARLRDPRLGAACSASSYRASDGYPQQNGCCGFAASPTATFRSEIVVTVPTQSSHGLADVWVRCAQSKKDGNVNIFSQIEISPATTNPYPVQHYYTPTTLDFIVEANLDIRWTPPLDPSGVLKIDADQVVTFQLSHVEEGGTALTIVVDGDKNCQICLANCATAASWKFLGSTPPAQVSLPTGAMSTAVTSFRCRNTGSKEDIVMRPSGIAGEASFVPIVTPIAKVQGSMTVGTFGPAAVVVGSYIRAERDVSISVALSVTTYREETEFRFTPSTLMPTGQHYCDIRTQAGKSLPWDEENMYQILRVPAATSSLSMIVFCANMVSVQDNLIIAVSDPLDEYVASAFPKIITQGTTKLLREGVDVSSQLTSGRGSFVIIATSPEAFFLRTSPPPSRGTMFTVSIVGAPPAGAECGIAATPDVNGAIAPVGFVAYDAEHESDPFYVLCKGSTGTARLRLSIVHTTGDMYPDAYDLTLQATGEVRVTQMSTPNLVMKTHFLFTATETTDSLFVNPTTDDEVATRFDGSSVIPFEIELIPPPTAAKTITISLVAIHACGLIAEDNTAALQSITKSFSPTSSKATIALSCSGVSRTRAAADYLFSMVKLVDAEYIYPTAILPFVLEGTVEMTLLDGSSIPETLAVNSRLHARLTSTIQENVAVTVEIHDGYGASPSCLISATESNFAPGPIALTYLPDLEKGCSVYILCSRPTPDDSTYLVVRNANLPKHIINEWTMVKIKALGTVFLTPSGESHTAPLPTFVRENNWYSLYLYVDPKIEATAPSDFVFEVTLVNPGSNPDRWPNCRLHTSKTGQTSESGQTKLDVAILRNADWSSEFFFRCVNIKTSGPSIVISPKMVGYTEFYGSSMAPRGYIEFEDDMGPLRDTIPLQTVYKFRAKLTPGNGSGLKYNFNVAFSSVAGNCLMWKSSQTVNPDDPNSFPKTTSVAFTDTKVSLDLTLYCSTSAVTGPAIVVTPAAADVLFIQASTGMMAINGVVNFIRVDAAGAPLPTEPMSSNVNLNLRHMFTLYAQPAISRTTTFRVSLVGHPNIRVGQCGIRIHTLGQPLTDTQADYSDHVDVTMPNGINSPSGTNVPAGTSRIALILRCIELPGDLTAPSLRVEVVTENPALMYSPRELGPIVIAGSATIGGANGAGFPSTVNATLDKFQVLTLNLVPKPTQTTRLRVRIGVPGADAGSCGLHIGGSGDTKMSFTEEIEVSTSQATAEFRIRCTDVSKPDTNFLQVSHISGEVYASFKSEAFTVVGFPIIQYRNPDEEGMAEFNLHEDPNWWKKFEDIPVPDGAVPTTIINTHTPTRLRIQLPVPPRSVIEMSISLDSSATSQGITGFFLFHSENVEHTMLAAEMIAEINDGAAAPRLSFAVPAGATSTYMTFFTTTPHQSGTNVLPTFNVTFVNGDRRYESVFGPRMRLRAGTCKAVTPGPNEKPNHLAGSFQVVEWYPPEWSQKFYAQGSEVVYSCEAGYYLADEYKRTDPTHEITSNKMKCEARHWVGPAFNCMPAICQSFEYDEAVVAKTTILPNSRNMNNTFATKIILDCIPGYVVGQLAGVEPLALQRAEQVMCSADSSDPNGINGVWLRSGRNNTGTPLECEPLSCGEVTVQTVSSTGESMYVTNAEAQGGVGLGDVMSFKCRSGFTTIRANQTATCMESGYWEWTDPTMDPPLCESLDCFRFENMENENYTLNVETIKYSKDAEDNQPFELDVVATVTCKHGYRTRHNTEKSLQAVCTGAGWSIPDVGCTPLQCSSLPPPEGAEMVYDPPPKVSNLVDWNTKVTVRCAIGQNAYGDRNRIDDNPPPRVCNDNGGSNGEWDTFETHCLPNVCPDIQNVPGENVTIVYRGEVDHSNEIRVYGNTAEASCRDAGFEVFPPRLITRTCGTRDQGWIPHEDGYPQCIAKTCPRFPFDANGATPSYTVGRFGPRRLGSIATLNCKDGYVIQDEPHELTCEGDNWVYSGTRRVATPENFPKCRRFNCKQLTPPRHGRMTYSDHGYGHTFYQSKSTLVCDNGFEVEPGAESTFQCTNAGWATEKGGETINSNTMPHCVDTDECARAKTPCAIFSEGAECVNTVGSYSCMPYIVNYTISIDGSQKIPMPVDYTDPKYVRDNTKSIHLVDTSGGEILEFNVFMGTGIKPYTGAKEYSTSHVRGVRFGQLLDDDSGLQFECDIVSVTFVHMETLFQRVRCAMPYAAGYNLPLSLRFCTDRLLTAKLNETNGDETPVEEDGYTCLWTDVRSKEDPQRWPKYVYTVNYPPPTSTPSSIKSVTFEDRVGKPNLVGRTSNGQQETISLSGTNFFQSPVHPGLVTVVFGTMEMLTRDDALETAYKCTIEGDNARNSTTGLIICEMDYESGLDLHFLIDVMGQRVISSDTFSFPIDVEVIDVSGCEKPTDPELNHTTINCPTEGLTLLNITGDGFLDPTGIFINGEECDVVDRQNTVVTCMLPPGTGTALSLNVMAGVKYLERPAMVSYAPPVITRMHSDDCDSVDDLTLTNCPRDGESTLTLMGSNFGVTGATVYIGGVSCLNVRHDEAMPHQRITCRLPQGSRTQRSVVVFQRYGELSAEQAYVSYTQCAPGTQDINYQCVDCAPGTYTDTEGQAECKQCPPGAYNDVPGRSSCSACRSGTFSPMGSSSCTDCPKGTFSTGNAGSCTTCSVGTFSPNRGANTCLPCPYGGTSDPDYAGCHCLSGFYLNHLQNCEACMEGGNCTDTGTTYFNVVPLPGFYPTAVATDADAPHVLRFSMDIVTNLSTTVPYENNVLLASLMRSIFDETGVGRDRVSIRSAESVILPDNRLFNVAKFAKEFAANNADAIAGHSVSRRELSDAYAHAEGLIAADAAASTVAKHHMRRAASSAGMAVLSGDEEIDEDDDSTRYSVPGVHVVIDVNPPVTIKGMSAQAIFLRLLRLMQAPTPTPTDPVEEASLPAETLALPTAASLPASTAASGMSVDALSVIGSPAPLRLAPRRGFRTLDATSGDVTAPLPVLMYETFGRHITSIKLDDAYSRMAFVNFEACLSPACVGGLQMCATGYDGPLCTVCDTGYSKTTTYLCESCGSMSSRVGAILLSLFIAIAICTVLTFFSVRDTTKNLDLPRAIRSVSHVAYAKIIVCAVQIWAIAAQFDMVWPGVLGGFMRVMNVAGNVGVDAISLDCFSSNSAAYGLSDSVRPLFLTTIGAFVLPLFALLFPLLILVPIYLVHRRRYARELDAVAYVAKVDAASHQASLDVSTDAYMSAKAATEAKARAELEERKKQEDIEREAQRRREEIYGRGRSAQSAIVKTAAVNGTSANAAAAAAAAANGGNSGSSVEMSRLGTASRTGAPSSRVGAPSRTGTASSNGKGPLAPPPLPPGPRSVNFSGDDDEGAADELFSEFNIDMTQPAPGSQSRGSFSHMGGTGAGVMGAAPRRGSYSISSSSSSSSLNSSTVNAAAAANAPEFHVDDFVEDDAADPASVSAAPAAATAVNASRLSRVGITSRLQYASGASVGVGAPGSGSPAMSAIREESDISETGSRGSRRPSISGSDVSRTSTVGSTTSSRRPRSQRNKSFRESLMGPRLTSRGIIIKNDVPVAGGAGAGDDPASSMGHSHAGGSAAEHSVSRASRNSRVSRTGSVYGDTAREPSVSRSQMARDTLRGVTSKNVSETVAAQHSSEYLQLQRDRRIFRFAVERLAELLMTYQYIYVCCIATALYLLHPNISRAFFRLIACKTVGDGSASALAGTMEEVDGTTRHYSASDFALPHSTRRFVLADMSLVCYSGEHFVWMFTLGLALFLVWVIGVPLGFYLYLRRNIVHLRAQPNQLAVAERRQRHRVEYGFAFLFLGFQPKWYYWFIVEMALKVLYVAVSIFFPGQMHVQLLLASFVAFAAISAQTAVRPFEQSLLEYFEFAALLVTFSLFFLANFYMIENEITEQSKNAITAAIFTSFMLFFVVAILVLILIFHQNRSTLEIRNAVRVALRRNLDPSTLLQTWRRERLRLRNAAKGKIDFDDNMRDMFVASVENDVEVELDDYLDGGAADTSASAENSRETSLNTSSSESGAKDGGAGAGDTAQTPVQAVYETAQLEDGTHLVAVPLSEKAAAEAAASTSIIRDRSTYGSETSVLGWRAAKGESKLAVSTVGAPQSVHSGSSSSLSTSASGSGSAPSAESSSLKTGGASAETDQSASAASGESAKVASAAVAAKFAAGKANAAAKSPTGAKAAEDKTGAAATAGAAAPAGGEKKLKKKKKLRLKKKRAPGEGADAAAAGEESEEDDENLIEDLERALATSVAPPKKALAKTDYVAETLKQTKTDAVKREELLVQKNRFGAIDVAEGRVDMALGHNATATAAPVAIVGENDNLFYQAEDEDDDILDNAAWAQNVTSGHQGYF